MSDLVDEIREDIKEERYAELWKRYGNYVIGAALLVIVGTGAGVWVKSSSTTSNQEIASEYYALTYGANGANKEEVLEQLSEMHHNEDGAFSSLSGLKQAAILKAEGRADEAAQLYKKLADETSNGIEFRALAGLLYVSHQVSRDIKEIDGEALSERLEALTQKDSPWRFHAIEQKALLELRLGNREKAVELFESIARDFSAPASLRNRAESLSQSIAS